MEDIFHKLKFSQAPIRSEEQIDSILLRIKEQWLKAPELRLAQLIANSHDGDIFYVEDDALVQKIENFVEKSERN